VRTLGQERLEGVEELFLCPLFAGEELDVVDEQKIEGVVLRFQLIEGLALIVLHDVGDELLGMQIEDARVGAVGQQRVADGVDQMRLAEADATIDEERVVHLSRRAGDVQRRCARHLVGAARNQRIEAEGRVEAAARRQERRRGGVRVSAIQQCGWRWVLRLRRSLHKGRRRPDRGVTRSERDVEAHRLAGEIAEGALDAAGVLGSDPVELEPVRNADRHHRTGVAQIGDLGLGQRPDPGVELLVGQLGGESFAAALPEVGSHVWRSARGKAMIVLGGGGLAKTYPQGKPALQRCCGNTAPK